MEITRLTEKITYLNCDCMEYLATLSDNAFELAIVDPPYGIDASRMTMGRGSGNDLNKHDTSKTWDIHPPGPEYFKEIKRVSKNQIIWGGNYFLDHLSSTQCLIVWDKKDYNSDFSDGECAWTSFDSVLKIYQRARSANNEHKGKIHPTQKPVALYRWLLQNYAKEGDKILDTHLGSGSIGIACHMEGFELVGCELDKEYYEASIKRFEEQTSQSTLF